MLFDKVCGDVNLIFLIDENEVIVGYAVSVGWVDLEEMYYLMSCGLCKEEVECLVICGFLGFVIIVILVKEV